MKKILLVFLLSLPLVVMAQVSYGNLSPLYVQGGQLRDVHGNSVVLHGVSDTPNPAMNKNRWGEEVADVNITKCYTYFAGLCSGITNKDAGASCNAFRLCLEPQWAADEALAAEGEPAYKQFSAAKMKNVTTKLYWRIVLAAMKKGLYVVVSAPDDAPAKMGAEGYQQYLMDMWDAFTQNDSIRKYSGQISLELAQCPQASLTADEAPDFFQPIISKIRANGFGGILWIPSPQGEEGSSLYLQQTVKDANVGYSVQVYPQQNAAFDAYQPAFAMLDKAPMLLTTDWSPKAGQTQGVASTSTWGKSMMAFVESHPGLSLTLSSTDAYLDGDALQETGEVKPAFDGDAESCGKACFDWYAQLSEKYPLYKPFKHYWTPDQGNGTFINPIMNGDFPDIDVIRVGDVYYMVSTTMYIFPGATIMKSYDLVNWEYCCNPLEKIDDNDAYNLLNGKEHYAQGQWATSLRYHDGKFYLYFISYGRNGVDSGRNVLLTCTDPEGAWKMQYMNEHYYDSGWMFDDGPDGDGYLYVACGIGNIYVNKIDAKTLKKISDKQVIANRDGLEGARMYHIGDFYYLYLTTGGYWRGQTIYRSKNPMGPYEEMPNLNKYGDERQGNAFCNNAIHQGGLVQTQTGEWWTIMFRDAGAIGRVPYLEPVEWVDGWPMIGNKGTDVSKGSKPFRKPNVGATYPRTYLPTSDSFTSMTLGKQWGWNHNPVPEAWSLVERPGYLRLHTPNVTTDLRFARNSLTQRIMGLNAEGSTKNTNSYGTIKLDVSGMMEGDVAGLSVFQDPYSFIGVTVRNGVKKLIYMQANADQNWATSETLGATLKSDTIYLRSIVNFSTSKCDYYYSYDNTHWSKFGNQMSMRFQLSVFVGQRFYIFNYATRQTGGYVDVDWFSTETSFSEEDYFGEELMNAYPVEEVTATSLKVEKTQVGVMPGNMVPVKLTCTMASGKKIDVSKACTFSFSQPGVLTTKGGHLIGLEQGSTDVTATYTDAMGNQVTATFQVSVSYFPLTTDGLNPNLIGTGTFRVANGYYSLKLTKNGFGGWHYEQGLDLSDKGRYLVVKMNRTTTTAKPTLRIYDVNDLTSTQYYASPIFGSDTLAVFDLQEIGQQVDLKHVYYLGFSLGAATTIYFDDIFLSDDGVTPTAIEEVGNSEVTELLRVEVFSLDGKRLDGLRPGINIIRRTFSDGHQETLKVKK